MKRFGITGFAITLLIITAGYASAQKAGLRLVPARGSSTITITYLKKRLKINLDEALLGTNGTLPGEEPHQFTVLFTTEKDGFLYLVAKVCSGSPVSNPMGPCGGDSPCGILWIKADKALKEYEVQAEIYASCSYNYYDSKLKVGKTGLTIDFGTARKKMHLVYENADADKGLIVTETGK